MLVKADVAQRLSEEMDRCAIAPARLAEKAGVSIQAITGWTNTGRFHRKQIQVLNELGMDVCYILIGQRTIDPAPIDADVLERAIAEILKHAKAFPRKHIRLHPDLAPIIAGFYADLHARKCVSDGTVNRLLKQIAAREP